MTEAENFDCSREILLRISPERSTFTVEEFKPGGIVARKEIAPVELYYAINGSYACNTYLASGLLPEHCIHVSMRNSEKSLVLWNPELRADVSYGGKEYLDFPIPRLVVGVRMLPNGKVVDCSLGVVEDGPLSPDLQMYLYPFSNVYDNGKVCTGNNVLPTYKKQTALKNFPRYLLGIPDNDDYYSTTCNRKGLSHNELLEHLKDKDPAYYYTDILVPSEGTLEDYICGR